jgi:ligand-binding sensor domain-containing protein/anti-sigma regulatory factor (Ser/Thr protein kinase)
MIRLLIILSCLALFKELPAQQIIFKNYAMQDGLVANPVRSIYQDAKGFIWIATWQGLSKYDGYRFTNFSTTSGLSFDLVNDIVEAEPGKLLVALNNGMIDMVEHDEIRQRTISRRTAVNQFFKGDDGSVYAGTDNDGLFSIRDGKFSSLSKPFPGAMNAYLKLNDSMRIIGGSDGISLFLLDRQSNIIGRLEDAPYGVYRLYRDSQDRVWACTYNGLLLIAPEQPGGQIKLSPLPPPFNIPALSGVVTDILEDADGNHWIATLQGLFRIDRHGRSRLYRREEGLASNVIRCIYMDREKNIWVGTELGISKIVMKNDVRIFTTNDGLHDNILRDVQPAGNSMYFVAANGALQKLDIKDHSISTITAPQEGPPYAYFLRQRDKLSLLSGNQLIDIDTSRYKTDGVTTLPGINFHCARADNEGNIFLGTDNGVLMKEAGTGAVRLLGGLKYRITTLAIDGNGDVWAGTWMNGLYRLERSGATYDMSDLVPDSCVRYVYPDSQGNVWVGTRYHGAVCIRVDRKSSLHFSRKDGLTSNFIFRIVEDRKGNIWLASYLGGFDKLLPAGDSYRIFNFSRVNNLFEIAYNIYPAPDNVFWCATTSGLLQFRDDETDRLPPAEVFITRVQTGKAGNSITVTDMRKQLSMDYHSNVVQFEFSAPSFVNEKEILYRHRLSGNGDTSWSDPGHQHTVFYDGLRPGKHTFEVMALGWNGLWSAPAAYTFVIHPPWWQTAWFIVVASLAAVLAITLFLRKRIQGIQQKTQVQKRIAETEMMALRAQMNPHFIFNCINSIDALIQSNDKYYATVYLNKFARLLRNILDSSKQNTVPLAKDLETLQLYIDLEQLRFENSFSASINADESLLLDDYKVPPLIVQPYVENAILHGLKNRQDDNGRLTITISRLPEHIRYVIEDNGVGREALRNRSSAHNGSYGMQMSSDRVRFFNNEDNASVVVTDLEKDGRATGTSVQVLLKIQ